MQTAMAELMANHTKKTNSWAAKRTWQKKISRPPTGKEGETPETPETRGT